MAASPRDLLKPRPQRLMEVGQGIQQQTGFADSQYVTFGCKLAPGATDTDLAISDGEISIAQSLVEVAAIPAEVLTGSGIPTTSASQYVKVLVEIAADGETVTLTPGAVAVGSQAAAALPALTPTRIVLGHLEIPNSFTPGTTALTTGMCVTEPYDAGNVSPAGTQSGNGSTGGF